VDRTAVGRTAFPTEVKAGPRFLHKGVLMERHDLDDQAAFDRLRRQARSSARKLAEAAREIISDHPR
jgi:hypothetical protein